MKNMQHHQEEQLLDTLAELLVFSKNLSIERNGDKRYAQKINLL